MRHVSDGVRTRRSAGLIWEGLVDIGDEEPLARVHEPMSARVPT